MIKLQNITKRYRHTTALDDISLNLRENKIYCLLGRNGAGKTTLMKLMAGHMNSSAGTIEVESQSVSTRKMPESVSFIENRAVQFNTKLEKLILMASDLDSEFDKVFAQEMMNKFHLDKDKKYRQLSFGMQTMFNTLLSLASNRRIILLDEPVLGLDAVMRDRFYDLLNDSFEHHPRIIIISTHLVDEITKSAEDLFILDKGKIIFQSSINEIDEKAYSITGALKVVEPVLNNLNVIGRKTMGGYTTVFIYDEPDNIPSGLTVQPMGLQELFVNMVGGDSDEE